MTFTEWYKETKGHEWLESYAELYHFAQSMSEHYEQYCYENEIEPIWNG